MDERRPESSVISTVNTLFETAITRRASDIHLEPHHDGLAARFRIDGMLLLHTIYPTAIQGQIIARIKVLAHMDISERRIPQDGKIAFVFNERLIDLRIATFPTARGEKMVVRILDRSQNPISLTELGLLAPMQQQFIELLEQPHGFLLVTGPTGSGKTTTLYAALDRLHTPDKHIITLEDPVEYQLDGITQGHINLATGFTFEKGIRAMLRQDPDILMIGEIRDAQSAQIAIQAALTGHLVLSTLHTHDAPSSFIRLIDMGIEKFLLTACLSGILAQRLARRICEQCKTNYQPTEHEQIFCAQYELDPAILTHGTGCDRCFGTGYYGRIGIFELLPITAPLRDYLSKHTTHPDLVHVAHQEGMISLWHDGLEKVRQGLTTLSEFLKEMHTDSKK